jgi:serine/threonine-protein kinase mTOR
LENVHKEIQNLIKTTPMGALHVMSVLINSSYADPRREKYFSNNLRSILDSHNENEIIIFTTRVLGKLAKISVANDWIEFETKRAMEWFLIEKPKEKMKVYSGILVLKEFAENSPTYFFSHVEEFLKNIWKGLRHVYPPIRFFPFKKRDESALAFRAVLTIVSERTTNDRAQYYSDIFNKVVEGFESEKIEYKESSINITKELLFNTAGTFMIKNYENFCEYTLKQFQEKDLTIKKSLILMLPSLIQFSPENFSKKYLNSTISYLLTISENSESKDLSFESLGKIILVNTILIIQVIKDLDEENIELIFKEIFSQKKNIKKGLLFCLSCLTKLLKSNIKNEIGANLNFLFSNGITNELIQTLTDIVKNIPSLLDVIQIFLLDEISIILMGSPYNDFKIKFFKSHIKNNKEIIVALKCLREFNFKKYNMMDFIYNISNIYLDDIDETVRKDSALTAFKLLNTDDNIVNLDKTVNFCLEKILYMSISDPVVSIRNNILISMMNYDKYDHYFSFEQNLKYLMINLNDQSLKIRKTSIMVIGKLSLLNPSYILQPLRKYLMKLLFKLEFSKDRSIQEESIILLGYLIDSSPRLIKPYVPNIIELLLKNYYSDDISISVNCLSTIGKN